VPEREGEQHNLILTQTYDTLIAQYGIIGLVSRAVVGTGSTPPAATQTGLTNEVSRTGNVAPSYPTYDAIRIANGVADILAAREFTEAQVGGQNLTEWGFSPANTAGPNLMCRELFRDGSNNPVVLTLASDQRLRLLYKMRVTVGPVTPQDVSINISGIGVRTGKLVMRKNVGPNADPFTTLPGDDFADIEAVSGFARQTSFGGFDGNVIHVVSGVSPSTYYNGTGAWTSNIKAVVAYQPYVASSRQRKSQPVLWNSNEANVTIYGIGMGMAWYPSAIVLFDSGQEFTKTNLYKLQIDGWTLTWGP
jgi:hypothetical protein